MTKLSSIPKCGKPIEILDTSSLESIHSTSLHILVIAHDIDPALRIVYATSELMRNTEKHCVVCPTSGQKWGLFSRGPEGPYRKSR